MIRTIIATLALLSLPGCLMPEGPTTPEGAVATFPVASQQLLDETGPYDCGAFPADRNQFPRSPATLEFDGYRAHFVKVCSGTSELETLVFWSKTNADFTRIDARVTTLSGIVIPFTNSGFDPNTRATTFSILYRGIPCDIIKPRNGVSPSPLAVCG